MKPNIEIIANDNNLCGEGPIWDVAQQRLVWTDISGSLVFHYFPATGKKEIITRGLMVAGIALNRDGALVFAGSTGMHLWRGQDNHKTFLTEHGGETLLFNDMIADAQGRIYAGTVYWGANGMEKPGKLYLVDADGSARVVVDGIEMANGLGFSPDNRTLYHADTSARKIYAYDVDAKSGSLSRKRVFVTVPATEGIPDGLTVDRDGFVWSAQWYGSQVVRYDPDGKVERRIALPVQQVSSVMFGGDEWNELYITSAGEAWPSDYAPPSFDWKRPMGGSLYRVRLDLQGRPEHQANLCPA